MNQDSAGSGSEHANHSDISVENEAETIDEKKEKHSVSPEQAAELLVIKRQSYNR